MKVRLHTEVSHGAGRESVAAAEVTAPHVFFHEDGSGRAELRWSASDSIAHTHNRIVRVEIPKEQADALRALVSRRTRSAYGQSEDEPPPETVAEKPAEEAAWEAPSEPRADGKPWTPPGIEPEPLEEKTP